MPATPQTTRLKRFRPARGPQIQMLKNKKNNKDRTVKERNQRILNIYSSHQNISDQANKAASLPLKKINKLSIANLNTKSKQIPKKQKNRGSSSIIKIKPPEIYQRIPIHFANSNTNSQIQFSNYGETIKEGNKHSRKPLFIDCDQQALIRQIWRVQKKRKNIQNQAATKIQKVFRGFLTRKLLLKYIEQYEERLLQERNQLKRKATYITNQEDSFYNCQLKNSYFSSNRKSKNRNQMFNSQDKPSLLQIQSSIMLNDIDHFNSIQDNQFLLKPSTEERKYSYVDKSSLTLNESSIAPQPQETSLSFGQEGQPSPHFVHAQNSLIKLSQTQSIHSPNKQIQKGVISISQDKTRDAISQNISICPSYYKHNKSQKQDFSHFNSIQKEQQQGQSGIQDVYVQKLRSSEKAKWEQVIEYVNNNLKDNFNHNKTKQLMSTILQFSVKNRLQLNKANNEQQADHVLITPTTVTNRRQNEQIQPEIYQQKQYRDFKKKKWQEQQQQNVRKVMKNQNMPFAGKSAEKHTLFERTYRMKQYFLKSMYLQDQQIDKMLQLRQSILRRRESNSLIQLNNLLQNNMLTQDEFLSRLSNLSHTFQRQKIDIEQTKQEIYQGYKAQLQLLKHTALDAKYLGYNLPFCRSMEIFPSQSRWKFDQLMIDQLNQLARRRANSGSNKPRNLDDNQSSQKVQFHEPKQLEELQQDREQFHESFNQEEDSVNFSYQQTRIYKKCQPFSMEVFQLEDNDIVNSPKNLRRVSPFNKFSSVAVFQNIGQQNSEQNADEQQEQIEELQASEKCLKREVFKFMAQSSQQEDEDIRYKDNQQKKANLLSELYTKQIIWEVVQQLFLSQKIYNAFIARKSKYSIEIISRQQKKQFLDVCIDHLPNFHHLKKRINQKMYPNSRELLMSMRQIEPEADQQQSEQQYLQIGQYEYILNQQVCYQIIETYLEIYRKNRKLKAQMSKGTDVSHEFKSQYQQFSSQKLRNTMFQRKIQYSKLLIQIQNSRQQILRIELHVIFDVWNEQLIKYRQNKSGYSGIGLNEISLCLIDRVCRQITQQSEYKQMMLMTKDNIQKMIFIDNLTDKLNQQYQETICKNDAQWILYTQEALQYGFDLAKMVQLDLLFQCLDEMHKLFQIPNQEISNSQSNSNQSDVPSLNDQQQQQLYKKMENMNKYQFSDQEDSFYN